MTKRKQSFRDWHHTKHGEAVAESFHWLWAILCFGQFAVCTAYCWMQWAIMAAFQFAPAAQALFYMWMGGSMFGALAMLWHMVAALVHRKARLAVR